MSENLFSPEAYVEGVAGSVAGLQRTDIYGLLLDCPAEHLDDLLQYLYEARPDMTDHVENLVTLLEYRFARYLIEHRAHAQTRAQAKEKLRQTARLVARIPGTDSWF